MKKHTRTIISVFLAITILLTSSAQVFAESQAEQPVSFTETNLAAANNPIKSKTISSATAEVGIDYWYENLPTYYGHTIAKGINAKAIKNMDSENDAIDISKSIASIQMLRLARGSDSYFGYWQNANLTEAISIYNLDDSLFGFAYGVVDTDNKIVGYLVTGVNEDSPPVLEYSYDPSRFLLMENASKVYFNPHTGILLENNSELHCITGDITYSASERNAIQNAANTSTDFTAIRQEWQQFTAYANIAEETQAIKSSNSTVLYSNVATPTASNTATQTRLAMDTSDHTWLTICSYTTLSMYFDAIGRRVEPALLGTIRPHSIALNQTLHNRYGCNPSFADIADIALDWANTQKLTSSLSFSNYLISSSNYNCWTKHKTQIDKNIPTMVGYVTASSAHIMMGIGYTSDNYYIVRDTWTNDGAPMNSTFYYNSNGYTFLLLGLDYTNSDPSTGWCNLTLRKGDSNFNVRRLKIMLSLLYYNPGSVTSNVFDDQTEVAVKKFQADWGLTVDGVVGFDTYTRLKNMHIMNYDQHTGNWRIMAHGISGDDVAQLQIRLYRMGYLNDTCDGVFGTNTENALKQFQAAKGLTADGIAGAATFAKIYGSTNSYIREYMPCYVCNN